MLVKSCPGHKTWSIWKTGDALLNVRKEDGWWMLCTEPTWFLLPAVPDTWVKATGQWDKEKTGTNSGQYVWCMQGGDNGSDTVQRQRMNCWLSTAWAFSLGQFTSNIVLCLTDIFLTGHVEYLLHNLWTIPFVLATLFLNHKWRSKVIQKLITYQAILGHSWCTVRHFWIQNRKCNITW